MIVLSPNFGSKGEQISLLSTAGPAVECSAVDAGGGEGSPLTTVFWCDINNTTPGTPNGSIENPFRSLQAAHDACTILGSVIYLAPVGNGVPIVVDLTVTNPGITLVGVANPLGSPAPIIISGTVTVNAASYNIQNIHISGSLIGTGGDGADLGMYDSSVDGSVSGNSLICCAQIPGVHGTGSVAVSGQAVFINTTAGAGNVAQTLQFYSMSEPNSQLGCNVGDWTIAQSCQIKGCVVQSNITAKSFLLDNCVLGSSLALNCTADPSSGFPVVQIQNCTKPQSTSVITFTCTGDLNELQVDQVSNQWMNNSVHSDFERLRVIGALPQIQVAVAVPGTAAGDVSYVDVDVSLTDFQGVTTGALVVANPTDDLVAAGTGGGFINARVSALNTVRFAFLGPLAGATHNFELGLLSRANVTP